ncbi:hypothetical protein LZ30DRAFT_52860 [Colletotrichum cereale]|nr:hypothetical protein LZ30DRAFT_52860 [Colletotrichum cereale]
MGWPEVWGGVLPIALSEAAPRNRLGRSPQLGPGGCNPWRGLGPYIGAVTPRHATLSGSIQTACWDSGRHEPAKDWAVIKRESPLASAHSRKEFPQRGIMIFETYTSTANASSSDVSVAPAFPDEHTLEARGECAPVPHFPIASNQRGQRRRIVKKERTRRRRRRRNAPRDPCLPLPHGIGQPVTEETQSPWAPRSSDLGEPWQQPERCRCKTSAAIIALEEAVSPPGKKKESFSLLAGTANSVPVP